MPCLTAYESCQSVQSGAVPPPPPSPQRGQTRPRAPAWSGGTESDRANPSCRSRMRRQQIQDPKAGEARAGRRAPIGATTDCSDKAAALTRRHLWQNGAGNAPPSVLPHCPSANVHHEGGVDCNVRCLMAIRGRNHSRDGLYPQCHPFTRSRRPLVTARNESEITVC